MLYELRLVADRRGEDRTAFARLAGSPGLSPANESGIVVAPPPDSTQGAVAGGVAGNAEVAQLMPQMSLEIRAALDGPLQKELAALRSFINTALDAHTERLHGDIAALVPVTAPPQVDAATLLPERRPWAAIAGWSVAALASAGVATLAWLWWQQGAELAALRGDLSASYAEVEALRARPPVVSATPAMDETLPAVAALVPAEDLAPEASPAPSATEPMARAATAATPVPAQAGAVAGIVPVPSAPAATETAAATPTPDEVPAAVQPAAQAQ
jgi:hypothetical protein